MASVDHIALTHLALDKMAAIPADDIFKYILNENYRVTIQICAQESNWQKTALVQVMAWRKTGDRSLPEPLLTQFTDAYKGGYMGKMS